MSARRVVLALLGVVASAALFAVLVVQRWGARAAWGARAFGLLALLFLLIFARDRFLFFLVLGDLVVTGPARCHALFVNVRSFLQQLVALPG